MKRRPRLRHAALLLAAGALIGLGYWLDDVGGAEVSAEQQALVEAASDGGAVDLHAERLDDGGMLLRGTLEGRAFTLAIPWRWNRQAALFAYGYRPPGFPLDIYDNPLDQDEVGFHRIPYSQGFATGRSAYAKSGMGVQTGVESTYRLKQLVDHLGATRTYLMGASMGGNITVALIEKHPHDFAGAIAWCGAVGGWPQTIAWTVDVRAAYSYFTRGTQYAIGGSTDIAHSALWVPPDGLPLWLALPPMAVQMKRVVTPIAELFEAAAKNPRGAEQEIIDKVAAVTGTLRDPASFIQAIAVLALGMDDLNQTFGGSLVDNRDKVYASPLLSAEEAAALNAGIGRIGADSSALAYAAQWYQPTGRFKVPLLTVYNEIDPLVRPELHETALHDAAALAGNLERLVQRQVPARREPINGTELEGYVHCGFTPQQVETAWNELRGWAELGHRPQ